MMDAFKVFADKSFYTLNERNIRYSKYWLLAIANHYDRTAKNVVLLIKANKKFNFKIYVRINLNKCFDILLKFNYYGT